MYGLGIAKGMMLTLKHLFRPPITIQYPEERQRLPVRSRATLVWYEELCTGCNTCAEACPDGCITVATHPGRGPAGDRIVDRYEIDFRICMYCALCAEACPYSAIRTGLDFEYATYDFDSMLFTKERFIEDRKRLETLGLTAEPVPWAAKG
jgi:NADH-quinone oxidoreductase subunit I